MSLMDETVVLPVEEARAWLEEHLARVARLGVQSGTCYTVYDLKTSCKCYFHQTDKALSDHDFYTSCVAICSSWAEEMVKNRRRFTCFRGFRSIEDAREVAESYLSSVVFGRESHVVASVRLREYGLQRVRDRFGCEEGYEIVPISFVCSKATPHLIVKINCLNSKLMSYEIADCAA